MSFKKYSPLTGEVLCEYENATAGEIEIALAQLHDSFKIWKNIQPEHRQQILRPVVTRLTEKKAQFAETITTEMGKLYVESLAEVEKCIKSIEACLDFDLSFLLTSKVQTIYKESEISYQPLGILYSVMPWNFPLWQAIRMILPGLLSGNVILLKHSEVSPEMGRLIEDLFADLFEKPLLKHRLATHEMTEAILADDRVQGVSITGSTKAGTSIANLATKYLKKFVLELGGSDPYIAFNDADISKSAKLISASRLQNTGQSCIAGKRLLVHESLKNAMIERLQSEFETYHFGLPFDKTAKLGPLADVRFKQPLAEQIQQLEQKTSAQLVFQKKHGQSENSAFVDSRIYLLKENSTWLKDQEFFAPILLVIPFKTDSEAIEIANSTIFGLGGGVFSENLEFAKKMAMQIDAGQVAINDYIKSDVSLPFGGVKMSGSGRELSRNGFMEFTEMKVISYS